MGKKNTKSYFSLNFKEDEIFSHVYWLFVFLFSFFFYLKPIFVYIQARVLQVITRKRFREQMVSTLMFILLKKPFLVFYWVLGLGLLNTKKYNAKFLFLKVLKITSGRPMCIHKPRKQLMWPSSCRGLRMAGASLRVLNWNSGAVTSVLSGLGLDI